MTTKTQSTTDQEMAVIPTIVPYPRTLDMQVADTVITVMGRTMMTMIIMDKISTEERCISTTTKHTFTKTIMKT